MQQMVSFLSIFIIIICGFTLANLLAFGGELAPFRTYEVKPYHYASLEHHAIVKFLCYDLDARLFCLATPARTLGQYHAPLTAREQMTLYTLYRSLLGADYFDEMYEVNRFLGPVLYMSWTLIGALWDRIFANGSE